MFFLSGQTWYQVFWTAPAGNAYYNLAHQYMAAELNTLNGAAVPANVQTALNTATTLFNTYTPAEIAALKGKNGNALRAQFIELAGLLGSYNEGKIGPGHCDEDERRLRRKPRQHLSRTLRGPETGPSGVLGPRPSREGFRPRADPTMNSVIHRPCRHASGRNPARRPRYAPHNLALLTAFLAIALAAGSAIAAKPAGGGGGAAKSSLALVVLDQGARTVEGATAHFGGQVTFDVSTSETTRPWVDVQCVQGGTVVYRQWHGMFDSYYTEPNFTLGPTGYWTGGAASCTARLVNKDGGRDRISRRRPSMPRVERRLPGTRRERPRLGPLFISWVERCVEKSRFRRFDFCISACRQIGSTPFVPSFEPLSPALDASSATAYGVR